MMIQNATFHIRNALHTDLNSLIELENKWPEQERATREQLAFRLEKFPAGYFIAESKNELVASIIACPCNYYPDQLHQFKNWKVRVKNCYADDNLLSSTNALYIISGTVKQSFQNPFLFSAGVNAVVNLAQNMNKFYVIAGALLPGYAKFFQKHSNLSILDYVFKKRGERLIDPLIERYRRIGFFVPDARHVLENYFPSSESLNYSALVVKDLRLYCADLYSEKQEYVTHAC